MARRLTPEAEFRGNWTSLAGALHGVLHHLRVAPDQSTLMGISGHAFRLAIAQSDAGIAAPESAFLLDYERAMGLYRGLGISWESAGAWPGDADHDRVREQLVARIRRSVDLDRPCVVYGLHVAEFGIVNGYDERADLLYVSTSVSTQYGTSLPLRQWPAPGHLPILRALFPERAAKLGPSAADRQALVFAVDYAKSGDPGGPAVAAHGLAAYDLWLEAYERGFPIDPAGNRRNIQILQAARRDAAAFLLSVAGRVPQEGERLLAAAHDYELEALSLSRMATLFPYPGGGDTESRGIREAAAASLREAIRYEREAISRLEEVVAALDRRE
jgi:hypothetical protein